MPTVEQNLFLWGSADGWKDDGDKWSEKWGSTELEWSTSIFPRIRKFLPAPTILEIAPGFGRWTQFLKGFCDQLVAVDVSPACIERCKERFASDSHMRCYVNDGRSLPMVEDASVDFAFSFDSLVHVEADVIAAYLQELGKKLKPGGFAFIHHSNLRAYRSSTWLPKAIGNQQPIGADGSQPGSAKHAQVSRGLWFRRRLQSKLTDWGLVNTFDNRAESMCAEVFREACGPAGLECRSQELVNWNHGRSLIDCFSVVTPRNGRPGKPPRLTRNPHFMAEAERARRTAELYRSARSRD
jgi:SAM-dependent methyltransferase